LSGDFFELGDPLDANQLKERESSGKELKIADDFLNSIIIFCLLVGCLAQLGIVPFLGHIFGNDYDYFISSTGEGRSPGYDGNIMQRRFLEDQVDESPKAPSAVDEKQPTERDMDAVAQGLEELDRELFGDSPLSLDGLLDDAELDDDGHDDVQEYDDALDERHGVLF